MIRTAQDSEDLHAFTHNTDFILTYSDLLTDTREFEAEHPGQQVRYIDRGLGDPGGKATIIDIETGARTIRDLVPWYEQKLANHLTYITMYVNRSNIVAANAALGSRPINRWVATLDGTLHVDGFTPMEWPALVQIADSARTGINADLSLVMAPGWNPTDKTVALPALQADLRVAWTALNTIDSSLADAIKRSQQLQ